MLAGRIRVQVHQCTIAVLVHVDECIVVGVEFLEPPYNCCRRSNGAHERVTRSRLCDRVVPQIAFLEFESDGYGVRVGQVRVVVRHDAVVFPEHQVAFANWFGSSFTVGFQIFATAHGEEKG